MSRSTLALAVDVPGSGHGFSGKPCLASTSVVPSSWFACFLTSFTTNSSSSDRYNTKWWP